MKPLKRLDVTPKDPYGRALRSPLRHVALSKEAFDALQRRTPDHIVVEADGVLIGQPRQGAIDLQYAFPNRDAFARAFPPMFAQLVPALSVEEAPLGIRLRLTDAPSRPYVEPVLVAHAFQVARDWLRMELAALPANGADEELAPGFQLRAARADDAAAIAELDAVAFPASWLTPEIVRETMAQTPTFRVLDDRARGTAIAFLRLRVDQPAEGYISDIALHPAYQRRGLGEAMMRWALARFRTEGLERAALTVSTDNAPAIALYRKLGFTAGEAGIDYRRPTDEDEVRQVLEKNRASHITVRKRY